MRIAILEDDAMIRRTLAVMLRVEGHEVVLSCGDIPSAVDEMTNCEFDLFLVDIDLKSLENGTDFVRKYLGEKPHLYITSKTDDDIIEQAVLTSPISYILKPFTKEQIKTQLHFAQNKLESSSQFLTIKEGEKVHKVGVKQIVYIKSDGNYLEYHLSNHTRLLERAVISEAIARLPSGEYIRPHNRYLVRVDRIQAYSSKQITLETAVEIPISQSRAKAILAILNEKLAFKRSIT